MKKRSLQRDQRNGNYFVWIRRDGVKKYFPLGPNRKQAQKQLDQIHLDIASGRIQFITQTTSLVTRGDGSKDMRIEELAHRHLEWVKASRAEATFKLRQYFVTIFVDFVGKTMVSSLDFATVERFHIWAGQRNGQKGSGGGNEALRHVKTMMKWATEHEVCDIPVRRFPKIRASPPATRNFTPDEISRLLAVAPADFRDMLFVGTATGLRPQELRQLTRADLLQTGNGQYCIQIERHKTAKQSNAPKPRSVPVSAEVMAAIWRQLDSHKKSEQIFLNGDGMPYTAHVYRRRLKRLCIKAGIKKPKPPYGLRHSFGTIAAADGTNQSVLAQLMGHSKLQTTDRYIANVDEAHKKTMDAVEKKIRNLLPQAVQQAQENAPAGVKSGSEDATECTTDGNGAMKKKANQIATSGKRRG